MYTLYTNHFILYTILSYSMYNSLYYIVICRLYYVLYFRIYISRWILLSQEEGLQLAETAFFSSGHFPRSVSGEDWQLRTPLLTAGIVSPAVLKGDMAAHQSVHYSFKMRKIVLSSHLHYCNKIIYIFKYWSTAQLLFIIQTTNFNHEAE